MLAREIAHPGTDLAPGAQSVRTKRESDALNVPLAYREELVYHTLGNRGEPPRRTDEQTF